MKDLLKRTHIADLESMHKRLEYLSVVAWMISDNLEVQAIDGTAGAELVAKNLSWDISAIAETLEKMLANYQPANGQAVEGAAA